MPFQRVFYHITSSICITIVYSFELISILIDLLKIFGDLITKGANLNVFDHENNTLLHYAVSVGLCYKFYEKKNLTKLYHKTFSLTDSVPIVDLLLKSGVNINAKNNDEKSALDLAKEKGNLFCNKLCFQMSLVVLF